MLMYLSILDTQDEKEKFTEVYEQYQHFCWYVANQMLGDDHLAEDAVQETFLALTRHLDKIEVVESSKTRKFLMTIVKSKAIDILRKQKGELSMEELEYEIPTGEPDALSQYITRENLALHLLGGTGVCYLCHGLHRDFHSQNHILHTAAGNKLFNAGFYGVFIAGVGMNHIPLCVV